MSSLSLHLVYMLSLAQFVVSFMMLYVDTKNTWFTKLLLVGAVGNAPVPWAVALWIKKPDALASIGAYPVTYSVLSLFLILACSMRIVCLKGYINERYHYWVNGATFSLVVGFIAFMVLEGLPFLNVEHMRYK